MLRFGYLGCQRLARYLCFSLGKKKKREKQINKQKEEKEQAEEQEDVPLEMRQQVQPTEQQEEKVCVSVWRMKADELQPMVVGRGVGI